MVSRRVGAGLLATVRDLAYHEFPAIQRFIRIQSVGKEPILIKGITLDALAVKASGATVYCDDQQPPRTSIQGTTPRHGVALARATNGLIFGRYGGGTYGAFAPDPSHCTIGIELDEELLTTPRTFAGAYWLLYDGLLADALRGEHAAFLAQLRSEDKQRKRGEGEPYEQHVGTGDDR